MVPTRVSGAPLPVAVAVRQSMLRVALAVGDPGELGHLRPHHSRRERLHARAQEIGVAVGTGLADRLEQVHPVMGHRGSPSS